MGKYGDEGDKLLFKIQNSGDYFSGLTDEELGMETVDEVCNRARDCITKIMDPYKGKNILIVWKIKKASRRKPFSFRNSCNCFVIVLC